MNYHTITKCDMLNGEGIRVVLWVSGCSHHCKGCHNPETWNESGGKLFDENAKIELFGTLENDYISGITFSGGDPLYCNNRETVTQLAKEIKNKFPNKTIWLYTGYKYEDIKNLEIIKYIDVLVDGKYEENLRDVEAKWVGSTNQNIIRLN